MTHVLVALVRSINSVVAKMRKALFYKGFAKIQKFRKVTKSLKNWFCPHFVHIICGQNVDTFLFTPFTKNSKGVFG